MVTAAARSAAAVRAPLGSRVVAASRLRAGPPRQRQLLIDACISSLHMYGPSRTTVQKVVGFAKMSPGIVRFYFDSKAAMLVASLQYLATEFDERVLVPVGKLQSTPEAALRLMVDLFLDPEIASPRKVSVWYTFWGEASSRQEYYDICGQKDQSFALLAYKLIAALIVETRLTHLDADGIALGLIGVLEVLWQDIAFQIESNVDRVGAKRRCLAYLGSVFPGRFAASAADAPNSPGVPEAARLGGWAYASAPLLAQERDVLFRGAWAVVGHEAQMPYEGDFLALDVGVERVLVVRDESGALQAVRNSCPEAPHTLTSNRAGRFAEGIRCKRHGLRFSWSGRHVAGSGRIDLRRLDCRSVGGLIFVRAPTSGVTADTPAWFDELPPPLMMLAAPLEISVAADWKVVVEQWLENVPPATASLHVNTPGLQSTLAWEESLLVHRGWSADYYRGLMNCLPTTPWHRRFIAPNHLLETRPDGLSVMQAVPLAPGRCLIRRFDYSVLPLNDRARAASYLAQRVGPYTRRSTAALAESTQQGLIEFDYHGVGAQSAGAGAWFRNFMVTRGSSLARERPPLAG